MCCCVLSLVVVVERCAMIVGARCSLYVAILFRVFFVARCYCYIALLVVCCSLLFVVCR